MKKNKRTTNLELVRQAAQDVGDKHSPRYYVEYIAHKYGRRVNNSDVTKSIGKWENRSNGADDRIKEAARILMKSTNYDYGLASSILKRVSM